MSEGVIDAIQLTATHDGEGALVVQLRFGDGRRSKVQLDAEGLRRVMAKAGAASALELVGGPWTLLDVNETPFVG